MQRFVTIPFKNEGGFTHVHGVAKFSPAGVVLEFESKIIGLVSNGVMEVRLSLDEIRDIKFRKGFMKRWASIDIRLNNFAKTAEVPNSKGKISLKIVRDDFEAARDAVDKINKVLDEHAAVLPPPQTSVASLIDGSEDDTEELK